MGDSESCLNYPKGGTENSHLKVGLTVPVSRFVRQYFIRLGQSAPPSQPTIPLRPQQPLRLIKYSLYHSPKKIDTPRLLPGA